MTVQRKAISADNWKAALRRIRDEVQRTKQQVHRTYIASCLVGGKKMSKKSIPDEIRTQVQTIVERFNQEEMSSPRCFYVPRFKGRYLYLDRNDWGQIVHICRLTYNGAIDNWDFAIFRYSRERYDPEEWMFPGGGYVDGTVAGAMRAGMEAYPA